MGYEDGESGIYHGALMVKNAAGSDAFINPGMFVYLWDSNGVVQACKDSIAPLRATKATCLCIHSGTGDLLANLKKAISELKEGLGEKHTSELRLHIGLGIDGTIEAFRNGKLTAAQVVERYGKVAELVQDIYLSEGQIEALVLNGESKWALRPGNVRTSADMKALANALGSKIREKAPDIIIGLSSFGALGYHADVRPMIEGLTPHCSFFTGQSYAAVSGEIRANWLDAVVARDEKSQAAVARQGWFRDDVSDDDGIDVSHDDLDRVPTFQGYKQNRSKMIYHFLRYPVAYVWALPVLSLGGRFDEAGLSALSTTIAIRQLVGFGKSAVAKFQRENRLLVDNIAGPVTIAKASELFSKGCWY